MAITVKVDGLRELEAALGELPKATGKNVLRRVLLARGKPIADAARAMAPDDERTKGHDLRKSIGVSTRLSGRQKGIHRSMFKDDKASVEVFVGAGPLPQAHIQEFKGGGGGYPGEKGPQPFMRPAWDAGKGAILDGIAADIWSEIKKSADRLARKTARLK
jgi:HK97 gp10 family phage protein